MLPSCGLYGVPDLQQQGFWLQRRRRMIKTLEVFVAKEAFDNMSHSFEVKGRVVRSECGQSFWEVPGIIRGLAGKTSVQKSHPIFSDDLQERGKFPVINTRACFHDDLKEDVAEHDWVSQICWSNVFLKQMVSERSHVHTTWQCWCHEAIVFFHSSISFWTDDSSFCRNCHMISMLHPFSQLWLIEMVSSWEGGKTGLQTHD